MRKFFTKDKLTHYAKRLFVYLLGMMFCAIGVNTAIKSDLGVSPNNAVPLVLSLKFPSLTLGTWVSIVYLILVFLQILILGKRFKWYNLLQFGVAVVFGGFVDLAKILCDICLPVVTNYALRLLYMAIGLVSIALGISLYMDAKIMMMPVEGFTSAIAQRVNRSFSTCKIVSDTGMAILAVTFSLIWFHRLEGIREGTVMITFGVGLLMKLFTKWIDAPVERFLFGNRKNDSPKENGEPETQSSSATESSPEKENSTD